MKIPYARQHIDDADLRAVAEVLASDYLTQGPAVEGFERAVARVAGAGHAVATNSATSALHVAMLALGAGPGDLVWTSPNSFVASANCARYCGADVDFVDIDPHTYNLSPAALAEKFAAAERSGRLPKVLIPVHFAGQSCEMAPIRELAARYGCAVVADASHAIGGSYRGTAVGSSRDADMTVFSFHPVKIVTSGEGGMVVTDDPALADRARAMRSHGVTRDPRAIAAGAEPWEYEQHALGFNYRLTDIQAALGTAQVSRIESFVARRRAIAAAYDEALRETPFVTPAQHPDARSAYHLYPIRVPGGARRRVYDALHAGGILVNVHYIPIHTQPYYRALGFRRGDFPNAESYYAQALSLPMYVDLGDAQVERVAAALRAAAATIVKEIA
jgi:UDP-4-amino-4,6-dideoxy-N-acetyl-beta-L-altrosamine transaminase